MTPQELTLLEELWMDDRERPGGTTAQSHVLELIADVRQRDRDIRFLLDALRLPAVGLYESHEKPGNWYLLYNGPRGSIVKDDLPDSLLRVMNGENS